MNILQMSISSGIFIIAIVIVRSVTLNKLPKSVFLTLWGLAACRLLIPFRIPFSFSFFTAFTRVVTVLKPKEDLSPLLQSAYYQVLHHMPQAVTSSSKQFALSTTGILWMIVAAGFVFFFCLTFRRNCKELAVAMLIKDHAVIDCWHNKQKLRRPYRILVSDRITTPLTYGIISPKIVLPKTLNWDDEQLMNYVLTHELQHIRHLDMVWKIILIALLCLHWFNPLVWVMFILANRDLELACDEQVIKQLGEGTKSMYALSLIYVAEQRSKFTPLYSGFSKNSTEERIISVMKFKKSSIITLAFSFALIFGATTVFATNAAVPSLTVNSGDVLVMDRNGKTYITGDNGITYQTYVPEFEPKWITFDEYTMWLDQEKINIAKNVEHGMLSQRAATEAIAKYDQFLRRYSNPGCRDKLISFV